MARRFVYVTVMGMLYRMTPKVWAAYCAAGAEGLADIPPEADMLGSVHNTTDWAPTDFKDAAA